LRERRDKSEVSEVGEIRCRISVNDYPQNLPLIPATWECWVVGQLKKTGIPAHGDLSFRGIERGTLMTLDDPEDFSASIYIWRDEQGESEETRVLEAWASNVALCS
jgi:hypothetical protein